MNIFPFGRTVLKNLFSKQATRLEKREFFPTTRGHVVFDVDSCIFCTLCARKCPAGAIEVDRNAKTWSIMRASCVQCAACVDACNKNSLSMAPEYTPVMTSKETETYHARVSDNQEDSGNS